MDLSNAIRDQVAAALREDVGSGDLTAALISPDTEGHARVISREAAVLCGLDWFAETFHQLDHRARIIWHAKDGDRVEPNQLLSEIHGKAAPMLTAERTALNFLQALSATATVTRQYVDAVRGTRAQIVDTRKTLPGLRLAQKYAVRVGGGTNHRVGLYDGVLIKENHIMAAGGISPALAVAKEITPDGVPIQIEVESVAQLEEALRAGANMILLDNFNLAGLSEAVRKNAGRAVLEASGGVSLTTVRGIAETGVDRISIGALTKDIKATDLSLRFTI